MKRIISHTGLKIFDECPQAYIDWASRRRKQKRTVGNLVGDATHGIAEENGQLSAKVEKLIVSQLPLLPEDEREEALARIEEVAANAREMAEADDEDTDEAGRELVYRWFFEESGWTLCAKPDKVNFVVEKGEKIMEIRDYKSGSSHETLGENGKKLYFARRKHKEQLFFFALVVSLASNWTAKIRLSIRYWGNKVDCKPFWYSRSRQSEELKELKVKLKRIEEYLASRNFPAKPGFWCKSCPLAESCQKGKQYLDLCAGRPLGQPLSLVGCA